MASASSRSDANRSAADGHAADVRVPAGRDLDLGLVRVAAVRLPGPGVLGRHRPTHVTSTENEAVNESPGSTSG